MSVSRFFPSKLIEISMNIECASFVQVSVVYTNLIVFRPKVVQLEMETIVNIGNIFWIVLRHYPIIYK